MIEADECGFSLRCDRIAYEPGGGAMLVLSAIGTATEVKAFRAALQVGRDVVFRYTPNETPGKAYPTSKSLAGPEGYVVRTKSLRDGHYHIVAISRKKNLIVNRCPEAIWRYLQENSTTPIDERWLDRVVKEMEADAKIATAVNKGPVNAALVTCDDEYLDKTVKRMVRDAVVTIIP